MMVFDAKAAKLASDILRIVYQTIRKISEAACTGGFNTRISYGSRGGSTTESMVARISNILADRGFCCFVQPDIEGGCNLHISWS